MQDLIFLLKKYFSSIKDVGMHLVECLLLKITDVVNGAFTAVRVWTVTIKAIYNKHVQTNLHVLTHIVINPPAYCIM